jgi:hypothetical protein
MTRWIVFILSTFAISLIAIALVKLFAVLIVTISYGGHYKWGMGDVYSVLKQGALMGAVLSIFVVLIYRKRR